VRRHCLAFTWTRERHDGLKDSAQDIHGEGLGWRVWGRRDNADGDDDAGAFGGLDD